MKKAIINYLTISNKEYRIGIIVCCIVGSIWIFQEYRNGTLFAPAQKAQPIKQLQARMEPKKLYPL